MSEEGQYIAGVSTAVPEYTCGQAEGLEFLEHNYSDVLSSRSMDVLRKVFAHPSVGRRYFAVDSPEELLAEYPDRRMDRFALRSVELSAKAAERALLEASLAPEDVSALVVNTCTGYLCPGISTYLLERMGFPKTTRCFDLVGSGCGGAIPTLQTAQGLLRGEGAGAAVLCVSVEVCSCTFQMGNDLGLIISNAIFGDGAAAAVVSNKTGGLRLTASGARYLPEYRDDVRYVYRNGQLHNHLSLRLPKLAAIGAAQVADDVLKAAGLEIGDIDHWAVHPGGDSIVTTVRDALGLDEAHMRHSRAVLSEYGNMSSPTVWFVLDKIRRGGIAPGERVMMLAFGAGMSAHAFLLTMTAPGAGGNP
jgi:predicted naringenin-chalcone synthase